MLFSTSNYGWDKSLICGEYKLSPTQRQIARLMLSGLTEDSQLARQLRKTPNTVNQHIWRISKKMHAASRAGIIYRFIADTRPAST